jgi:hypothetical protein
MITQTIWIERKFEFNFPVGLFPVIVERLRRTFNEYQATHLGLIPYFCSD